MEVDNGSGDARNASLARADRAWVGEPRAKSDWGVRAPTTGSEVHITAIEESNQSLEMGR